MFGYCSNKPIRANHLKTIFIFYREAKKAPKCTWLFICFSVNSNIFTLYILNCSSFILSALLDYKTMTVDQLGTYIRLPDDPDQTACTHSDDQTCSIAGK